MAGDLHFMAHKKFKRCPSCDHENHLFGCKCPNKGCICHKKANDDWNNQPMVNGGDLWTPHIPDEDVSRQAKGTVGLRRPGRKG
jgi:hypothetical protein